VGGDHGREGEELPELEETGVLEEVGIDGIRLGEIELLGAPISSQEVGVD